MKTAVALLFITAIIVAATWFITRELRNQVTEQELRLQKQETLVAELQKRPRFVSYNVDTNLQNMRNARSQSGLPTRGSRLRGCILRASATPESTSR